MIEGTYIISYRYDDSSGNPGNTLTRTVIVRDSTAPVQTLNGASTIYVEFGSAYTELGATWTDAHDGTGSSIISGFVNVGLGSYTVSYDYRDVAHNDAVTLTRTVVVRDTIKPIQTLNGASTIYVEFGSNYSELGAIWTDAHDGTGSSEVSGSVNVGILGTYTITYNYLDYANNNAIAITRTIVVRDTTSPTFTGESNYNWNLNSTRNLEDILSKISVNDLFSGDLTSTITIQSDTYSINSLILGNYTIVLRAIDSSGNISDFTITISIIDDMPPVFTTTLVLLTLEYANSMTQQDYIDYFNNM